MQYYVIGADGKEYGPTSIDEIREWVKDNRVAPHTQLRSFETGQVLPASSIAGLFPSDQNPAAPPAMVGYPRTYVADDDDGRGELLGAIWRSAAALVLFFFLHGIGLIFAGYAVFYAVQANSKGHRLAKLGLGISIAALIAILIGWYMRMQGLIP